MNAAAAGILQNLFFKYASRVLLCIPVLLHASEANDVALLDLPISSIQDKLNSGELTSRQLVEKYKARIGAYDQKGPKLNAISVLNPKALERAEQLDKERKAQGPRGPLHGIPILIKDNYETADMQTAVGSNVFKGWIPPHDATIVKRLRDAGAIIMAKTNTHEFAMGHATHGSLFGQTRNPYALDRVPGGSSGGTGSAIAANFAPAGFGSDTCGSIRVPAAFNSLVGLRSTVGLSSRRGIVPLSHSWDTGGPLTHNVSDLAIIYDAIAGYDPADPQTAASRGHIPVTYTAYLKKDGLSKQRIGVLTDLLLVEAGDEEVASFIRAAADVMKKAGAEIVDVNIPGLLDLMADDFDGYFTIITDVARDIDAYLAAHSTAPVSSVQDIINSELLEDELIRANLKTALQFNNGPSLEYLSLQSKRQTIKQAVLVAMAEADVDSLIYPTVRRTPAKLSEKEQPGINCHLSGHTNFPAISVPAGFTKTGLPVSLEIMAREWQEPLLIQLAYAFEQATRHRRLPLTTPPLRGK